MSLKFKDYMYDINNSRFHLDVANMILALGKENIDNYLKYRLEGLRTVVFWAVNDLDRRNNDVRDDFDAVRYDRYWKSFLDSLKDKYFLLFDGTVYKPSNFDNLLLLLCSNTKIVASSADERMLSPKTLQDFLNLPSEPIKIYSGGFEKTIENQRFRLVSSGWTVAFNNKYLCPWTSNVRESDECFIHVEEWKKQPERNPSKVYPKLKRFSGPQRYSFAVHRFYPPAYPKFWEYPLVRTDPKNSKVGYYLHLGVELETNRYDSEFLEDVSSALPMIPKEDGSINGAEWVTHPATLPNQLEYWKTFYGLIDDQEIEYLTDNDCGLHVHVPLAVLSMATVGKLQGFINCAKNEYFIERIAGRYNGEYCNISDVGEEPAKASADGMKIRARGAVYFNFRRPTLEIRIFSAPNNFKQMSERLEFVDALVRWVRVTSSPKVTLNNFKAFVKSRRADWPALAKFLGVGKPVNKKSFKLQGV